MSKKMELDEAANLLGKHIAALGDSDLAGLTIVTFVDSLQDGDTPRMALALARDVENDVDDLPSDFDVEDYIRAAREAFEGLEVPKPAPAAGEVVMVADEEESSFERACRKLSEAASRAWRKL